MMDDGLAAIIERQRADQAIPALKSAGIYDERRRIEPIDDDQLAIPVTASRTLPEIDRFEPGLATQRRCRTLADHLRARGWREDELEQVPTSYARIGDIVVVQGDLPARASAVGEALLDLHGDCEVVLQLDEIEGDHRRPTVSHIAGSNRTETIHREHGIRYALDLREVMFSPGNQHERTRMRSVVSPSERVVDLCAGIGYFTLPMATAGAQIVAIERNPASYRWLSRNITTNDLDDRITPVCGDCRGSTVSADRAVIGHLPVHDCRDDPTRFGGGYLDAALDAVDRGWLHVHGIAWAGEHSQAESALAARLERRDVDIREAELRRVKGLAPRMDHVVIDVDIARA